VTIYPKLDEIIAVQYSLIEKFGGTHGLLKREALESALARPQSGYYSDLIQEAAALWESLSQNHPFLDGNKRLAVTVACSFLKVNGFTVEFHDLETFEFLNELYRTNQMNFHELETWLRKHTHP
jgi:death-on-curing protein